MTSYSNLATISLRVFAEKPQMALAELPKKVYNIRDAGKKKSAGMAASLFHSNTKWQFIFGCILIALVIIAVIVLISASLGASSCPAEKRRRRSCMDWSRSTTGRS